MPAEEEEEEVLILVAIEPQMYREVLAFSFRQQRPRARVVLVSPQTLHEEVRRTKPHLIFAGEVPPTLKQMGIFWVEVHAHDVLLEATISANGYSTIIADISLEDLLAVVDKAEEELPKRSRTLRRRRHWKRRN